MNKTICRNCGRDITNENKYPPQTDTMHIYCYFCYQVAEGLKFIAIANSHLSDIEELADVRRSLSESYYKLQEKFVDVRATD